MLSSEISNNNGKIVSHPSVLKCEVDNIAIGKDFGVEMLHSPNAKNMILRTFLQESHVKRYFQVYY
jgi:hypothetical protein